MALRNGKTSTTLQTTLTGSVHPTGVGAPFWGTTAPQGWVLSSGKTIGNFLSGATERADDDTFHLFDLLWTSYSNSILAIQDSSGAASTRGASSTADFAANKRMPTIDLRGRAPIGKDDMGGSAASRITSGESGITGTTLGSAGGAESHALSQAQLAVHTHTQNAHVHRVASNAKPNASTVTDVGVNESISSSVFPVGLYESYAFRSGSTPNVGVSENIAATNQNTGSGSTHQNTQPSIICNYIIKL